MQGELLGRGCFCCSPQTLLLSPGQRLHRGGGSGPRAGGGGGHGTAAAADTGAGTRALPHLFGPLSPPMSPSPHTPPPPPSPLYSPHPLQSHSTFALSNKPPNFGKGGLVFWRCEQSIAGGGWVGGLWQQEEFFWGPHGAAALSRGAARSSPCVAARSQRSYQPSCCGCSSPRRARRGPAGK